MRSRRYARRAGYALLALLLATTGCAARRTLAGPAGPSLVTAVTAVGMTVGDADRSLDFYSRGLGFRLVSDVELTGDDLERLEGVFSVRMRVVRMELGDEQIELTEYLAPRDGRPASADLTANDVAHWKTSVVTDDVDAATRRLRAARTPFVSPGPVALVTDGLGFRTAAMVRDPDGHALRVLAHAARAPS